MKAKKLLPLIAILFFVWTPVIQAFELDNDEVDSSVSPFKKSRNFSVIDEVRGEDNCHDLVFCGLWGSNDTYSVYIWKHIYSDTYEIKSYFESDIINFLSITNTHKYNLSNIKWRKDGRQHVKFKCDNFVRKLTKDSNMRSIE